MTFKQRNRSGWLLMEVLTAMTLLATLIAGLGLALKASGKLNHYHWQQQRCIAAGMAQLDCIGATGEPIKAAELERLWPSIELTTEQSPGEADWAGLTLIKVKAKTKKAGKVIEIELSRYISKTNDT